MTEKQEFIARIKTLRDKIGEIYPVLETKEGKIIDGWHRLQAHPNWKRRVIEPSSAYDEALIWFAAHERRRISRKEIKVRLITMAEELIKQGFDRGEIATKIAEDTGYTLQHVLSLLPAKYKHKVKRVAGKKAAVVKRLYKEEIKKEVETLVGELLVPYHEALKR